MERSSRSVPSSTPGARVRFGVAGVFPRRDREDRYCPGSFSQKSRPRSYLIETTAADLHSPQHFWSALPKTERHKRRLILPARIRAETGYGDGVAPQLRSEHEPEERLPQPRPEQRAGVQLAQAAAAGARAGAVAAAHARGGGASAASPARVRAGASATATSPVAAMSRLPPR